MPAILRVTDANTAREAVNQLLADGRSAEILARATRRAYGRPLQTDAVLDVSALAGITVYEPGELVLSARPGTPLSTIRSVLAEHHQHLAFEPPDFGRLWGSGPDGGTIGGCLSLGLGGPRRPSAGAPRDHFLGVKGVNGFGQAFAAGGRVVKNVTGFDLPKLLAGSLGTLALMTEITIKVMPAPPSTGTLLLHGLDDVQAIAVMREALSGAAAISAAAHFPASAAINLPSLGVPDGPVTALRFEGFERSVEARLEHLMGQLAPVIGERSILDESTSKRLWADVADVAVFASRPERPVWRLSTLASMAATLAQEIVRSLDCRYFFDWGGAVLWLELPPGPRAHRELVRAACGRAGTEAHASLVRADEAVRRADSPLPPLTGPLAALTERVKLQFDPRRIFNPGRLYAEL